METNEQLWHDHCKKYKTNVSHYEFNKIIQAYLQAVKQPAQVDCRSEFEAVLKDLWKHRNDPFLRECNDPEPDRDYEDFGTQSAWELWQAAYNRDKLREAVVILPDDATPEWSDVVYSPVTREYELVSDEWLKWAPMSQRYPKGFIIIKRNGKPVVYQSALSEGV
jgi:hypothetical protein